MEVPVVSTQKVAIVTGSARGIGAAVARRLASDGLAVAVLDLNADSCADTVKSITDAGGKAIAVGADVSDADSVAAAVDTVVTELGAPTVLINNAGIIRDNMLFKMSVDDWDAVMAVHLRGAFNMSKACQKHMVDAGWGRIVNLSSTSALGNRGQANYSAAKAGILGFSAALALELGRDGITVNTIAPGFIETDGVRTLPHYQKIRDNALARTPIGRLGVPRDIAGAVCFLASEAAGYITGATLHVTGGRYAT